MSVSATPVAEKPQRTGKTVVDTIVDAIVTRISSGSYLPGQRLIENELTQEFNVGRGSVREALNRLVADGLVAIEPYRGALVAKPSNLEVESVLQIREVLEGLAGRLAAERINEENYAQRLAQARLQALDPESSEDVDSYLIENREFHDLIHRIANNRQLTKQIDQLQLPTMRLLFFHLTEKQERERSRREHVWIAEAILDGDPDAAEHFAKKHVRRTAELSRQLSDEEQ